MDEKKLDIIESNEVGQEIIINNSKFILRHANDDDYSFIFGLLMENMFESFIRNWGFWNEESFKKTHRKTNIRIIEYEDRSIGYVAHLEGDECLAH